LRRARFVTLPQHFGVYVDDIDAAVERSFAARGELVAARSKTDCETDQSI
jgi:hypothetical protein